MKYKSSNKIISVYLMLGLILLVIGFSYAFFIYNKTGLYTHTITGGKMKVIYDEVTGNNITIENAYPLTDKEAKTKALEFEFTITGYNESDKNVYYAIEIDHGEDISDKNRFLDSDFKLSLYENDEEIFKNEVFEYLDDQDIYYGYFKSGTSKEEPSVNNYKLRIWINDYVYISDTVENDISLWDDEDWNWIDSIYGSVDATDEAFDIACGDKDTCYLSDLGISVYTSDEFANSYANFKINVRANLNVSDFDMLYYDANGGTFDVEKSSLLTNRITSRKPVMENKGFLGWSSDPDALVPEYKSGDYYDGGGQVLYAIYSDTRNVMSDFLSLGDTTNSINAVYFMNVPTENIEAEKLNADSVYDLTLNNQGSVTGLLYDDILYVVSDGTTYLSTCKELFVYFQYIQYIDFSNADTSMVTDMSCMFSYYDEVMRRYIGGNSTLIELDLTSFNTSNVTDMSSMFVGCWNLKSINLTYFDTSNVTNMYMMFYAGGYGSKFEELDLSSFDTSNVEDMSYMFYLCNYKLLELNLSNFNTSKVKDMSYMFYDCNQLEILDISNFDTSNVENMSHMFDYCKSLTNLDLTSFNTSNVMDMSYMFNRCQDLIELNTSYFTTSKVTNMSNMFYLCESLITLDLSSFDTSNVTDMSYMFRACDYLTILNVSNFDTSKVEDMQYMFAQCSSLITLDVSSFDTNKVTSTVYMFYGCSNLKTIYSNTDWNTPTNTDSGNMFYGCTSLVGAISYDSLKKDVTYANPTTGYFTTKTV